MDYQRYKDDLVLWLAEALADDALIVEKRSVRSGGKTKEYFQLIDRGTGSEYSSDAAELIESVFGHTEVDFSAYHYSDETYVSPNAAELIETYLDADELVKDLMTAKALLTAHMGDTVFKVSSPNKPKDSTQ